MNDTPAKMQNVCDLARTTLVQTPFFVVSTDDNLMSAVVVNGSFDPEESWSNGIFHNSRFFQFHITPMAGKRYYDPADPKVTVELITRSHKLAKFRKCTVTVPDALERINDWINFNSKLNQEVQ